MPASHPTLTTPDTARLAGIWEAAGRPPLRIDPTDLAAASRAVRSAIPELVVAILIAEGRSLGELVTLTASIVAFYEASGNPDWRRATKFDHVAFAELTEPASANPVHACFTRSKNASSILLVEWDLRKPGDGGIPLADVDAYVKRREALSGRRFGAASSDAIASFRPVVEAAPTPAAPVVRHPKFGEGTVLERLDGGKLRIDFGSGGVRVLAESFVTVKS